MSPEFDMLADKREQLEEEIRKMREGIQLISEWDKLKNGQWSEEIRRLLSDIDPEIANIAGGEPEPAGMGMPPAPLAPPAPAMPAAPEMAAPPAPPIGGEDTLSTPEAPAAEAAPEVPEAAPLEPPMASQSSASKKNSYQSPDKKGISASSETKKEGSMATDVQKKLADIKTKREAIKKEAQVRVAAAWTIAKTMLPAAPADVQKAFAANLLTNPTKVLNAALRQTAKNAHYTKLAEQFKEVHKVELNDLLEDPSVLKSERASVEKEIKGEAKSATAKTADDRKDAGPQTETYNDGRGHGGGPASEPKEMDAGSPKSQTEAEHRPMDTVNKSEGDKAGKEASAKTAHDKDCKGCKECEKEKKATAASAKKAHGKDCKGCDECKKEATTKTAEPVMEEEAPAAEMGAPEAPAAEAPVEEMPPMHGEEIPGDASAEMVTDEKTEVVMEEVAEIKDAISAIEQAILNENAEEPALPAAEGEAEIVMDEELPGMEEEVVEEGEGLPLDLASVFSSSEMEDKVSALANEGDGNGMESYFGPTSAEQMEASLEGTQMASMEDFFSLQGSDGDPLASLIASDSKIAESVAGHEVVPSFTGEAADHFESDEAKNDTRDNESDHKDDLFDEALKEIKPEEQGAVRTKQDCTNEMQAPKSAAKAPAKAPVKAAAAPAAKAVAKTAAPVIKRLKPVAAEPKNVDIATALFGRDEF
jgi:hypothetical protein